MVIGNTYQYFQIINSPSVQYCWSVVKSLLLVFRDCRLLESCTSRSLSWADLFLSVMATQQTRTLRTLIQPCPGELQWLSGYVSKVTVNRDIYLFYWLIKLNNFTKWICFFQKWFRLSEFVLLHTLKQYLFLFSWRSSQLKASPLPCPTLYSVSTRSGVRRILW